MDQPEVQRWLFVISEAMSVVDVTMTTEQRQFVAKRLTEVKDAQEYVSGMIANVFLIPPTALKEIN